MRNMANILVVEDNDDVREMMAVTLELEGHEVATAVNGRDALDKLHSGEKPCLILLDLMMPVMNGWEFQRALDCDPELRDVPVVVVSAATGEMIRKTDAVAFLPKPLDMDRLLDLVGEHCDGSRARGSAEASGSRLARRGQLVADDEEHLARADEAELLARKRLDGGGILAIAAHVLTQPRILGTKSVQGIKRLTVASAGAQPLHQPLLTDECIDQQHGGREGEADVQDLPAAG